MTPARLLGWLAFGSFGLALGLGDRVIDARQAHAAPNRFEVVETIARCAPGLVLDDHAFTDAVASELHRQDPRWGRNGKRGNPADLSHDALAWRNPASPAGGVSVVDIIVAAGSPSAEPAWIDQTAATIEAGTVGAWVAPSGRPSPCSGTPGGGSGSAGGGAGSGTVSPPASAQVEQILAQQRALLDALAHLSAKLDGLQAQAAATQQQLAAHASRAEVLVDRQTRRIFGTLVEEDGSTPVGVPQDTIDRLYQRSATDRLRVRAW